MSDKYHVTEEFRSWIRDGIDRKAKWLLVYYAFSDNLDFPDYCMDDAALELERAADRRSAAQASDVRLVGVHDLRGSEQEIIRRVQRSWAAT